MENAKGLEEHAMENPLAITSAGVATFEVEDASPIAADKAEARLAHDLILYPTVGSSILLLMVISKHK